MDKLLRPIFVTAKLYPDRIAFGLVDRAITYRQLADHVLSAEAAFGKLGLNPSHPIGVMIFHPVTHLIVTIALMKAGFTTVALAPDRVDAAVAFGLREIVSDCAISHDGVIEHRYEDAWITRPEGGNPWRYLDQPPDRIVRISFSSGSTGVQKAIGHSAATLTDRVIHETFWKQGIESVALCQFGVTAFVGFNFSIGWLRLGRTLCFALDATSSIQVIERHKVELVAASTVQAAELVAAQRKMRLNLKSLRRLTTGGGILTQGLHNDVKLALCGHIEEVYAATEAGTSGLAAGELMRSRNVEVSRFLPVSEVRIVDPDTDEVLAPGETGLVSIRSATPAYPFTGEMTETEALRSDVWFYPGDVGRMDRNGMLVISGRVDELINLGGAKHAPEYLEGILGAYPGLSEVAVTRIDQGSGKGPAIWVVCAGEASPSVRDLSAFLERQLNRPTMLDGVLKVAALPRAGMGKIARRDVRKMVETR
jgi:acyl-coenzyme A synthetase/AMP-(fatty) acid ligase